MHFSKHIWGIVDKSVSPALDAVLQSAPSQSYLKEAAHSKCHLHYCLSHSGALGWREAQDGTASCMPWWVW